MLPKLNRAIEARAALRSAGTDALRLVNGRDDGFEDIEIDAFAGRWLLQTREQIFPGWLRGIEGPRAIYWKQLGEQKVAPSWVAGEAVREPFVAMENGMRFWIDFEAGYSQGIFLDQRDNRAEARRRAAGGKSVLNCFAYTCAFGLAGALGGAATVNIDLSKRYLDWGRRNYELNGLDAGGHEFIFGEVGNWLERFARKSRLFDIVILDPPTFSRDRDGKVFRVEHDFPALVRGAESILAPGGALFCSTNQRTLTAEGFGKLIKAGLTKPAGWRIEERPMPLDFPGDPYLKACWVTPR